MKAQNLVLTAVVVSMLQLAVGCNDEGTTEPQTGTISVSVVDVSSNQPVPGVEITLEGTSQTATTDANGIADFEVGAGDYFVDASLCCIGPGFIEYHVAVTVLPGKTADVTLHACLACV